MVLVNSSRESGEPILWVDSNYIRWCHSFHLCADTNNLTHCFSRVPSILHKGLIGKSDIMSRDGRNKWSWPLTPADPSNRVRELKVCASPVLVLQHHAVHRFRPSRWQEVSLATTIELMVSSTLLDVPSHDSLRILWHAHLPDIVAIYKLIPFQAMKLRVFYFSVVLLTILALRMSEPFKCGESCNRTFANSRGLTHHRNACRFYLHRKTTLAVDVEVAYAPGAIRRSSVH